jgi:hypothetical protein
MNIFIDESGKFKSAENSIPQPSYEFFVAVIISDRTLSEFDILYGSKDKKFLRINAKYILTFLDKNNCKVFVTLFDSNACLKTILKDSRQDYINNIYAATKEHPD